MCIMCFIFMCFIVVGHLLRHHTLNDLVLSSTVSSCYEQDTFSALLQSSHLNNEYCVGAHPLNVCSCYELFGEICTSK